MLKSKQYGGRSIIGAREYQEDDFGFVDSGDRNNFAVEDLIAVVADGMGGHAGGDIASSSAVSAFVESARDGNDTGADRLRAALDAANAAVGDLKAKNPDLAEMGCTLVAVSLTADSVRWVSVGDSRLFLLRGGELHQLNQDHSLGALLDAQAAAGEISAEEAQESPRRNALTSAITGDAIARVDLPDEAVEMDADDRILLASDGIDSLSFEEIAAVLGDPQFESASELVEALLGAIRRKAMDGQDNATAVVIVPNVASLGRTQPLRRSG